MSTLIPKPRSALYAWTLGILLSSTGFYFGYSMTTYTTYFDSFKANLLKTTLVPKDAKKMLGSLLTAGAVAACVVGGKIITLLGNRRSLLIFLALELVVFALHILPNIPILYVLRFIAGFILCFWSLLTPGMIVDTLPETTANVCVAMFGVFLTAGVSIGCTYHSPWLQNVAATIIAPFLGGGTAPYVPKEGIGLLIWNTLQLTWQLPFEFLKFLLFLFVFRMESPSWMVSKRRTEKEFEQNYLLLYNAEDARALAKARANDVQNLELAKNSALNNQSLGAKVLWIPVFLAILFNVLNQVTGINFFALYSYDIFKDNGCEPAGTFSFLFGFSGFVGGIAASFAALRFSLRSIIVWGMGGQVLGQLLMIAGMTFKKVPLIVGGPYVYNFAFSFALSGPMYAYGNRIVSSAIFSYCVTAQWVLAFVIATFAQDIRAKLLDIPVFFICLIMTAIGTLLLIGYMVDITGDQRDDTERKFTNKKFFS